MSTIPVGASTSNPYAYFTPKSSSSGVTKDMFMQLLVAQLKNQNPLNPSDGTEFIGELAQFEQLEQSTNTGQDISAIRQDIEGLMPPADDSSAKTNS